MIPGVFTLRRFLPVMALLVAGLCLAGPARCAEGKVNINQASVEELALLPRIGPSVAQRIVEFREENGPFQQLEDLLLVRGVGEKTFERLRPWIALEGQTTLREKVRDSAIDDGAKGAGR